MTLYLCTHHVREGGDDTRCVCPICFVDLTIREEGYTEWMQCPTCKVVGHGTCIRKYVVQSGDTFVCPSCRTSYDGYEMRSNPVAWCANELIASLKEEKESDFVGSMKRVRSSERCLRSSGSVKETKQLRSRRIVLPV